MVWTAPTPRTTGELITASIWNTDLKDNLIAVHTGEIALTSQVGGDFIYAIDPFRFGRLGSVNNAYAPFGGSPPLMRLTLGRQTIWVPAAAMRPDKYIPCRWHEDITTNPWSQMLALPFPNTDGVAGFTLVMPKAWDKGNLMARLYWTSTTASAGNVVWYVHVVQSYGQAEAINTYGSFGSGFFVSGHNAPNALNITADTAITVGGSPATDEWLRLNVYRAGNDGNDTLPADAWLLGARFTYNCNVMTDD